MLRVIVILMSHKILRLFIVKVSILGYFPILCIIIKYEVYFNNI